MTVTGMHKMQTRMSEQDRLAMKMLVTFRISFCLVMTKTKQVFPTRPIASTMLYATIKRVVPVTDIGHLPISSQLVISPIDGRLLLLKRNMALATSQALDLLFGFSELGGISCLPEIS